MESAVITPNGMAVTPHYLATQTAVAILREGGSAIEAIVAAAATIAVVYPHMNSIGSDSFWLIIPPHGDAVVIDASGPAGSLATREFYCQNKDIPYYGPKSALTVPGTIDGWRIALQYLEDLGYKRLSIERLLNDAISYAEGGYPVSHSQEDSLRMLYADYTPSEDFDQIYTKNGVIYQQGERFRQRALGKSLKMLVKDGLRSFYDGELSQKIAVGMEKLGMPITKDDLKNYHAFQTKPLNFTHSKGQLLNVPPPTQGVISQLILGILDNLKEDGKNEGQFIHETVEATKQAFVERDKFITDPRFMKINPEDLLTNANIQNLSNNIDPNHSFNYIPGQGIGDTVWLGAMDNKGFSVSFIQSLYHDFGSRVVIPNTGILWHNRGVAFTLKPDHILTLEPGKKPFHTLNPAAAILNDGRHLVYGTRGGDGQPQTQAAIFHRYVVQGMPLTKSVSSPRWLYGRYSGNHDNKLKLESRFSNETVEYLKERGHDITILPAYSELVGQAGIIVRHPNGFIEGAGDPRDDGSAAGF